MDDLDITDAEIDEIAASISDEDILDAYEDSELMSIPDEVSESVIELSEILSRAARIKAKATMRRSEVKRDRKKKIALKRKSNNAQLLKRARRLAIKAMKQKLAKKSVGAMSFTDKVRVEKIIARRKVVIDRVARKLLPRVRKIEQTRLTHSKYTK
jgi:hypothetical protein